MRNLPPEDNFTTSELKVNVFASSGPGDELIATGEPLHRGRRTQVWEVRVTKEDRLAANFICTQMVLPGRRESTPPGCTSDAAARGAPGAPRPARGRPSR